MHPRHRWGLGLGVLGLVGFVTGLFMGKPESGLESETEPEFELKPEPKGFPEPIAVGYTTSPKIAPLLKDMANVFEQAGIDLDTVTPAEVTKRAANVVAIPPRDYWPRMARTLSEVFQPIRNETGPLVIRNGYRSPSHNKAVGGASKSRHQSFEALDLRPSNNTREARLQLAQLAAQIYRDRGAELRMGFGVYGPANNPNSVHVDTGSTRRTWGSAKAFL